MSVGDRSKQGARDAARSNVLDRGVRLGIVAYGVTHLIIAATALPLAWGDRSSGSASQEGAFAQMSQQPLGDVLLTGVALGLVCMALWQALEAFAGHRQEKGGKRLLKRTVSAGRAVVYAALAWTAASTAWGNGASGSGGSTQSLTARVMSAPGGTLLVGAVGLAIVGVGAALAYQGWSERFTKHLENRATSGETRAPVVLLGKVGYLSKGVALGVVGALFLTAAVQRQPRETGGLDEALHELLRQPFGSALLAVVALGLGAFGAYCFFWARYLRR